jgi:Tfp pilus assembly protein PilF
MKGMDYWFADNWSMAIDQLTKAMQLETYIDYYDKRGYAYLKLGQYQNAVADYTKAIQIDPDYALAYVFRVGSYLNLGQTANADADKAKACSLDSQYC